MIVYDKDLGCNYLFLQADEPSRPSQGDANKL